MRLLTILALCSFSLFSCKSTQITTPVDYPNNSIVFGSGGGFTGLITEYTILDNGQFFKKVSNEKEYTALSKVRKNQVNQLFESFKTLNLSSVDFQHAGNMNTFLKLKTESGVHEINWGVPGPKPPSEAKLFYSILMNLVKQTQS